MLKLRMGNIFQVDLMVKGILQKGRRGWSLLEGKDLRQLLQIEGYTVYDFMYVQNRGVICHQRNFRLECRIGKGERVVMDDKME